MHEVLCFEPVATQRPRRLTLTEESRAKMVKSPRHWEKDEAANLRRNRSTTGERKAGKDWSGRPYRVTLRG